jgi:branched-chain amino acid transport system substrate-binding protein
LRKAKFAILIGAAAIVLLAPQARADVTIGILMPTSGFGAGFGAEEQGSIDMFMERYSDLGPAGKLKLVIYDTRGEPAQAISLTRKLIDSDKVLAIVGPYFSGESEAAFPVANRAETPIVTPSSAKPGIAAANRPWAFRNASTTDKIDAELVEHWVKSVAAPIKKVVVTRAKALEPDGIVITALFTEAGHVTRELRKQGMKQPILAGVELSLDHKFIETAGDASEGVITAAEFNRDNPKPAVVEFVKEYQQRVNRLPGNSSALMYDALFLMRHCIVSTGVTGATQEDKVKIRDCWANIRDVEAPIAGPSTIDANGEARKFPNFLIVRDGKFVVNK